MGIAALIRESGKAVSIAWVVMPPMECPDMPTPTVAGHSGKLWLGNLGTTRVACLEGRVHAYEGHAVERVVFGHSPQPYGPTGVPQAAPDRFGGGDPSFGGTGSFGHAVLKRFLKSEIHEIRIFSRDEKKQDDMRKRFADPKLKFYLGDVRDRHSAADKNCRHALDRAGRLRKTGKNSSGASTCSVSWEYGRSPGRSRERRS